METTNTINQKIEAKLRNTRQLVSNLGSLLGKTICFITVDNVDLSHKEKEMTNSHPRLVIPLKKFMVNTELISATKLVPIGEDLFIELNGKADLRARVVNNGSSFELFAEANDMNSVEEAINRAITGQTPIFFSDRRKLTQEINFRNKNEMQKAEELADSFLKQYTVLKDLIKMQDDDCEDYYKQYGC